MKVYAIFFKEDNGKETFIKIVKNFDKWFKEQNKERKLNGEETPYFKGDFKVYEDKLEVMKNVK